MTKDILMIAAPHGNERLGDKLFSHLLNHHPDLVDHVDIVVGNPAAVVARRRYTDTDFNRSFSEDCPEGYEKQRALEVRRYISNSAAKLVLDMHTTRVDEPPCFIAYNTTGEPGKFMAASKIHHVVKMSEDFARQSLIGHIPHAVSVEVSDRHINKPLLDGLALDMRAYLGGMREYPQKQVYEIAGGIPKLPKFLDADASEFINFQWSDLAGFFPILMGENSYRTDPTKQYLGFYAERLFVKNIMTGEELPR